MRNMYMYKYVTVFVCMYLNSRGDNRDGVLDNDKYGFDTCYIKHKTDLS